MQVPWELELKGRMGLKHLGIVFFGERRITVEQMKLLSYSNWAKLNLTEEQLYYATFDAQVRYRHYILVRHGAGKVLRRPLFRLINIIRSTQ